MNTKTNPSVRPAFGTPGTFGKNRETTKYELYFSRTTYDALPDAVKSDIKSRCLWSRSRGAWVSRALNFPSSVADLAVRAGLVASEDEGERLSFADKLTAKAERSEQRAERFEQIADRADASAVALQAEFNKYRGDIAFLTQPIMRGHKGSERFARVREKIIARYERGFAEQNRARYWRERAQAAEATAQQSDLNNIGFCQRRIKDADREIAAIERSIDASNEKHAGYTAWMERMEERLEALLEKRAFYAERIAALGGIAYSAETVKKGQLVKRRGSWYTVLRVNRLSVTARPIEAYLSFFEPKIPYAEIQDVKDAPTGEGN